VGSALQVDTRVARLTPLGVHRFLPQDTAYCAPAALHVTFDRFIACAWVASVLHVLAITFR